MPVSAVVATSASAPSSPTAVLETPIPEASFPFADGVAPQGPAPPPITRYDSAKVIARIGSEVILAGEILGPIDEQLATIAKGAPEEEVEKVREMLVRKKLDQAIQQKLIICEARRKVGDGWKNIETKCGEMFEELEVPKALKRTGCHTREELDAKLHEVGNSVEREKRAFLERNVAQDWVRQQAKVEKEVAHEQLLAYYLEHATEYDFETKMRWEQLMVRFASYPSKADAYRAIAAAGNRVLGGEQFGEVCAR